MNQAFRNSMLAGWILTGGLAGAGTVAAEEDSAAQSFRITIDVADYAQVEPKTLARARAVIVRIFAAAGVRATLVDAASVTARNNDPTLYVNILSREMAEVYGFPLDVLGLAPGNSQGRDRKLVYIFDHVADELVQKQDEADDKGLILGHAIAHEIGHVLLNMPQHSRKGMMQARWDRRSIAEMAVGGLTFSREQVERIQAEVARRSRN